MKTKNLFPVILIVFIQYGCSNSSLDASQKNKLIVQEAFKSISSGDYDQMDLYFDPQFVRHCQATPQVQVHSLEAFKEFIRQDRLAIPDQIMELKYIVSEDNLVAFWGSYKGTQTGQMGPFKPSNKFVELDFSGTFRLENQKIKEAWIVWDNLTMLTQLGHFEPESMIFKNEL